MSNHEKLTKTFQNKMQELETSGARIAWNSADAYATWLVQTFHYVSHSTRLLALAASRFTLDQNKLHSRFVEHLREEKGHEILALNDLKKIGRRREDFDELSETKAFYQTQYYWIEHVSPLSFYGYILCLEGYAVRMGGHFYERVTQNFGPDAANFLKVHKSEDTGHLAQAFEHLKFLPEHEIPAITENLTQSCDLYGAILSKTLQVEKVGVKKSLGQAS